VNPPRADVGRACFSDEVAIDFPSVTPVVERMRESFLGTSAVDATISLDVVITPAEARRGRDLFVVVPICRTCAVCGGRGEVWGDACHSCDGVGHALDQHETHVTVPPGVRHDARLTLTVRPLHAPAMRVDVRVVIR